MAFPFIYMFKNLLGTHFNLVYIIMMVIVGTLFVTKIKIKKPGFKTMIAMVIAGILMFIVMVL